MTVTIRSLQKKKDQGARITMLTCYDATFARLVDAEDIDAILVGDSLGMVIKGEENTLTVTVEEIAYHVRAVARGAKRAHIVGDMPFLSYSISSEEALRNAGTLIRAGAASVKLEGGAALAPTVERLVAAGIPVMGHVGLLPQSVHAQSGFRVQGRDDDSKRQIIEDALALERAGAFAIVVEGIPADVAVEITSRLRVPTIGIGAGVGCDGQVLVLYDLLGLNEEFQPKFVKTYVNGAGGVRKAIAMYRDEVQSGTFPGLEHSFGSKKKGARTVPANESKKKASEDVGRGYGPAELEVISS